MRPGCSGRHGDGVPPSTAARVLYSCSGDGSSRLQLGHARGYTIDAGRVARAAACFNRRRLSQLPSRFVRRKPQDPVTRTDEILAFEDTWRPPAWFDQVTIVLVEP